MAYTTPEQIALETGRDLADLGADRLAMWIGDVELQIRARLGDLALLDPLALEYVTRMAVADKLRNPTGDLSTEVRVDDGAVVHRHGPSSRYVSISDELWLLLDPISTTGLSYSIAPG